eukprot:jgi/Tetstr1/456155/TSEL_042923.t1
MCGTTGGGSGKVTVQPGWVMEDCLHHMETFSILNAGPLLEEARVKAIMPEKELRVPSGGRGDGRGSAAPRRGGRGSAAPKRGAGQRGANARGRMTEVAVLVSPESLHAAEAAQPHRH